MVLLVVRVYPKRKYQLFLSKSEEKQHKHDFTCQAPSNGILGWWSHDQLPKMVEKKVVVLHCSFLNLLELWSEVLLLWRYQVRDSSHHQHFQPCCVFLHENNTKQHDFNKVRKLREKATIIISWEKWPKKKVHTLKGKLTLTDYKSWA